MNAIEKIRYLMVSFDVETIARKNGMQEMAHEEKERFLHVYDTLCVAEQDEFWDKINNK